MRYRMQLIPSAFRSVADGTKRVEMRLYDEKRSKLNVGDQIEFEQTETHETVICEVVRLTRFADFFELYAAFPPSALGYGADGVADPNDMYAIYSPEAVRTYGVLAIEIALQSNRHA